MSNKINNGRDFSGLPSSAPVPTSSGNRTTGVLRKQFLQQLLSRLKCILDQHGKVYVVMSDKGNSYAEYVGSRKIANIIRDEAFRLGLVIRKIDLNEIVEYLQANAEKAAVHSNVYYRVAPIDGGVVIDLGDDQHTHVKITAGNVEVITQNSKALFYRSVVSRPMVMPAAVGNLNLLKKYLNLHPVAVVMLIAWISYTLGHAKMPATNFVILMLQGNQGTGKTLLCKIIQSLVDPNSVGVQIIPCTSKELAISAQNAHCLFYDNVRGISQSMSDNLCIAATGGAITQRQLYSDDDMKVLYLHVPLVLNGIYDFVNQPDLAQRCLPLQMQSLLETDRKSEELLIQEFHSDLPAIWRGLIDLIAEIYRYLPEVEVENPERMIDFVRWLAAIEKAENVPVGVYQAAYSDAINQGQLDSLVENPLAALILEFADNYSESVWSGTPQSLLEVLNSQTPFSTQRSRQWPQNAISLSKRLAPLQSALQSQGVDVQFGRGKYRTITIRKTGQRT